MLIIPIDPGWDYPLYFRGNWTIRAALVTAKHLYLNPMAERRRTGSAEVPVVSAFRVFFR